MSRTKKDTKKAKLERRHKCKCQYCIDGKGHCEEKRKYSCDEQIREFKNEE